MKVYFYADQSHEMFVSRGKAIDDIRWMLGRNLHQNPAELLAEADIDTSEEVLEEKASMDYETGENVVRVFGLQSGANPPKKLFLSEEEVKASLSDAEREALESYVGNATIRASWLVLGHLAPAKGGDGEYPYHVAIEKGDKGFFARINTNPDRDGMRNKGKIFFPDKRWKNVLPGMVNVKVTAERDGFGFIVGKYADYSYNDVAAILDYLWANEAPWDTRILRIEGSVFGDFLTFAGLAKAQEMNEQGMKHGDVTGCRRFIKGEKIPEDFFSYRFVGGDGDKAEQTYLYIENDEVLTELASHIVMDSTFGEMLLEDLFHEYIVEGKPLSQTLVGMFKRSEFLVERGIPKDTPSFLNYAPMEAELPHAGRRVVGYWRKDGGAQYQNDEVMTMALNKGLVVSYMFDTVPIPALGLNEDSIMELVYFNNAEFKTLLRKFAKVNAHADELIVEKLKSGKLRLDTSK